VNLWAPGLQSFERWALESLFDRNPLLVSGGQFDAVYAEHLKNPLSLKATSRTLKYYGFYRVQIICRRGGRYGAWYSSFNATKGEGLKLIHTIEKVIKAEKDFWIGPKSGAFYENFADQVKKSS